MQCCSGEVRIEVQNLIFNQKGYDKMQTRTYPRYRYLISVIAFIDFPLWVGLRHHSWIVAMIMLAMMMLMIGRRFAEIGWHQVWAVPWCVDTVCPFALLYFYPTLNPWLALVCVAVLQVPLMLWPSRKQPSDGEGVAGSALS